MSKLHFYSNKTISIGVEVELQLVDPLTGNLKPVAPAILETLKNENGSIHIKTENFQSMLEIDTPICSNAHEAGVSLRASLQTVRRLAHKHDAQVMMAGTHPFAHYTERFLTPNGRYFSLVDRNKWIARRLQIFGLHVHLGMRNGDHPYLLHSWNEFEELVQKLILSKSITSLKDLWGDIRPNTEFGTIEVRIADCPPTINEVEAIVAFLHALAVFIDFLSATIANGRSYERQRKQNLGDLKAVVQHLVRENENNIPEWVDLK